jgi:hypothetical protein
MAGMTDRWRNVMVLRETLAAARSGSYVASDGTSVQVPAVEEPRMEIVSAPHFNVMALKMHRGPQPTLVGVVGDCDALTAVERLRHTLSAHILAASDEALLDSAPEAGAPVSRMVATASVLAAAAVAAGACVAPGPRSCAFSFETVVPEVSRLPPSGDAVSLAVLTSFLGSAPGGWASTGAWGVEEDLHRRSDLGVLVEKSDVRKKYPLEEGSPVVWTPNVRILRGPAKASCGTWKSPRALDVPSSTVASSSIVPVMDDSSLSAASEGSKAPLPDFEWLPIPISVNVAGVVPPTSLVTDRALKTNETALKPSSRRQLFLAGYAQFAAALEHGSDVLVVDCAGAGGAGCKAPAIAVARLYRQLLFEYFPGAFQLVVFATGGAGGADTAVEDSADASASASESLLELNRVEEVASAAVALTMGTERIWDDSSGMSPPAAVHRASDVSSTTMDASVSSSTIVRRAVKPFSDALSKWSLTTSTGQGARPIVTGDHHSITAKLFASINSCLPSVVANHLTLSLLHVFHGSGVALPAPATSRLRHLLGVESTPPESSLVTRRRQAEAIAMAEERPRATPREAMRAVRRDLAAAIRGSVRPRRAVNPSHADEYSLMAEGDSGEYVPPSSGEGDSVAVNMDWAQDFRVLRQPEAASTAVATAGAINEAPFDMEEL